MNRKLHWFNSLLAFPIRFFNISAPTIIWHTPNEQLMEVVQSILWKLSPFTDWKGQCLREGSDYQCSVHYQSWHPYTIPDLLWHGHWWRRMDCVPLKTDGSVCIYLNWCDYEQGFASLTGDYILQWTCVAIMSCWGSCRTLVHHKPLLISSNNITSVAQHHSQTDTDQYSLIRSHEMKMWKLTVDHHTVSLSSVMTMTSNTVKLLYCI